MVAVEQTELGRRVLFDPREFVVHLLEALVVELGCDASALQLLLQLAERLFVLVALALEVLQVLQARLRAGLVLRVRLVELLQQSAPDSVSAARDAH